MTHRLRGFWIGCAALLAIANASRADVLHLTGGGRLEGVLTRETTTSVTIDVGMGQVSVPRTSVARIERKASALSEYRSRLSIIARGDVSAFVDLARFAADNGLRSESRLMWSRVLSLDPRNVEAHLALGHVLVNGTYMDEEEAYRAQGLVRFEGRWMTAAEQESYLREREQRSADNRRVAEARREAREAEDRARRAEAEASRARAEAAQNANLPIWGYGGPVIVGSPHWRGHGGGGCLDVACTTTPPLWPQQPPRAAPTPMPRARPLRPSSIR